MSNLSLDTKIELLPNELKSEVNDFIDFLIQKSKKKLDKPKAIFGSAKGKIEMAKDFDEPLDDFKDYM